MPRTRERRPIIAAAISTAASAAFGATLSIGIAWAADAQYQTLQGEGPIGRTTAWVSDDDAWLVLAQPRPTRPGVTVLSTWGNPAAGWVTIDRERGVVYLALDRETGTERLSFQLADSLPLPRDLLDAIARSGISTEVIVSGWPLRCLYRKRFPGDTHAGSWRVSNLHLPHQISAGPLALNAALYSAVMFALIQFISAGRRALAR